jgi:hypothetical protein
VLLLVWEFEISILLLLILMGLLRVRMDMRRLLDSLLEYDIVSDWFSRASMCD